MSRSVFLGWLTCFTVIPKTLPRAEHPCTTSSSGGKEQGLSGTGRKNELIACSSLPSAVAYSGVTRSIHQAGTCLSQARGDGSRLSGALQGSHGRAALPAPGHRPACLQVRIRLGQHFKLFLSDPVCWQSIALTPLSCPDDQNSSSPAAGGSILLCESKETIFISGFP